MAYIEDPVLPNMQFEDGDVLVKLSSNPKTWLMLHSDILAASSSVMARSLLGGLAGPHSVWHPGKQESVKMWTLLLQHEVESDTYWLQSERTSDHVLNERLSGITISPPKESKTWDVQHKLDHDYDLCVCLEWENWKNRHSLNEDPSEVLLSDDEQAEMDYSIPLPVSQHDHRSHARHAHKFLCETDQGVYRVESQYNDFRDSLSNEKCIHDYDKGYRTVEHFKIFFALLYGFSDPTYWHVLERGTPESIFNILSYAHYYDCVGHVAVALQSWMVQSPDTFRDIEANWIDSPGIVPITGDAKLAHTLRCGPVLIDHVRNATVNARTTHRPRDEIAKILGLSIEELDAMAPLAAEPPLAATREEELLQEMIKGQLHACIGVTDWDMVDDEDEDVIPTEPGLKISEGLCKLYEATDI